MEGEIIVGGNGRGLMNSGLNNIKDNIHAFSAFVSVSPGSLVAKSKSHCMQNRAIEVVFNVSSSIG